MVSKLGSAVYHFFDCAKIQKLRVQLNPLFPDFSALWLKCELELCSWSSGLKSAFIDLKVVIYNYLGTEFGIIFDLSIVRQQYPLVLIFLYFYVMCEATGRRMC